MSVQQSATRNASVEQPDKYDELGMRGLYESPHLAERPLMAHIENAPELMAEAREAARTRDGQPLQPTVEGQCQAARDYDWTREVDLAHDGRFGETLAQQERRLAEERELERYSETALAAEEAGLERERSSRLVNVEERRQIRADFCERAALASGVDPGAPDPRELLSEEELAAVNQQARRLADSIMEGRWSAVIARRLAEAVRNGRPLVEATIELTDELYQLPEVIQPIATVDPRGDNADIEGEVMRLFEPASPTQQQVGYLQDETGSVKVTIWRKSHQSTLLHEGDRVRIYGGKPGAYRGRKTLAVVYDSRVRVIERGEGPAPRRGFGREVNWGSVSESDGRQRPRPCKAPSLTDRRSKPVPRSEAGRFRGRERWIYPAESCPDWFGEREDVSIQPPVA